MAENKKYIYTFPDKGGKFSKSKCVFYNYNGAFFIVL